MTNDMSDRTIDSLRRTYLRLAILRAEESGESARIAELKRDLAELPDVDYSDLFEE